MVILVDFDGTLTIENGDGTYRKNDFMVDKVWQWIKEGHTVKLYTARKGADLLQAKRELKKWGIPLPYAGPKLSADLYVDDRSIRPEDIK